MADNNDALCCRQIQPIPLEFGTGTGTATATATATGMATGAATDDSMPLPGRQHVFRERPTSLHVHFVNVSSAATAPPHGTIPLLTMECLVVRQHHCVAALAPSASSSSSSTMSSPDQGPMPSSPPLPPCDCCNIILVVTMPNADHRRLLKMDWHRYDNNTASANDESDDSSPATTVITVTLRDRVPATVGVDDVGTDDTATVAPAPFSSLPSGSVSMPTDLLCSRATWPPRLRLQTDAAAAPRFIEMAFADRCGAASRRHCCCSVDNDKGSVAICSTCPATATTTTTTTAASATPKLSLKITSTGCEVNVGRVNVALDSVTIGAHYYSTVRWQNPAGTYVCCNALDVTTTQASNVFFETTAATATTATSASELGPASPVGFLVCKAYTENIERYCFAGGAGLLVLGESSSSSGGGSSNRPRCQSIGEAPVLASRSAPPSLSNSPPVSPPPLIRGHSVFGSRKKAAQSPPEHETNTNSNSNPVMTRRTSITYVNAAVPIYAVSTGSNERPREQEEEAAAAATLCQLCGDRAATYQACPCNHQWCCDQCMVGCGGVSAMLSKLNGRCPLCRCDATALHRMVALQTPPIDSMTTSPLSTSPLSSPRYQDFGAYLDSVSAVVTAGSVPTLSMPLSTATAVGDDAMSMA